MTVLPDNVNWLEYPENQPQNEGARYYDVVLKDGTLDVACWWLSDWYCYPFPFDVVGYKKQPREMNIKSSVNVPKA